MRKPTLLLIILLWPRLIHAQDKSDKSVVLKSVTVIDIASGKLKTDMTVVITGNKIASVSKKAKVPKNATVLEGKGKYLLPGLWDMHVHALRTQGDTTIDKFYLPLFIANGITGVRDLGNSSMSMTEVRVLRSAIEQGKRPGPRFFVCGPLIDGRASGWRNKVIVTTEQEGRAAVDSLNKTGVDFLKVYSWLSPQVYTAIAEEATKQGIPFVGHVPELLTAWQASKARQKSIEHLGEGEILLACSSSESHLRQERLQLSKLSPGTPQWREKWDAYNQMLLSTYSPAKAKDLFALFLKNSTWQAPTLPALYGRANFIESSQANEDRLKYVSTPIKTFWSERTESRKKLFNPASVELLKQQYQKELQLVAAMNKAGVPLLAGTDNGNPFVFPGFSLHDELGLLVAAGLSPLQALQAATLNPAKYFGLTASLGTVEEGKLADLLLLEANPLEDITNTKKIAAVVANGRYFSKQALNQLLESAEEAARKQ
jgi:imidazolonepropionase-like amidohydrolase